MKYLLHVTLAIFYKFQSKHIKFQSIFQGLLSKIDALRTILFNGVIQFCGLSLNWLHSFS